MIRLKRYMIVLVVLCLALAYRWPALVQTRPLWVDEFATVDQANLILKYGPLIFSQTVDQFEYHNITTHAFTALSFILFGQSESSARLPSLIFGCFIPVLVYLLTKRLFKSPQLAIMASLLSTFSYFQITWSVQARSYSLQQFLLLLTLLLYLRFYESRSKINIFFLLFLAVLGLLTHTTYWLVIMTMILHFVMFNYRQLKNIVKRHWLLILLIIPAFIVVLITSGSYRNIFDLLLNILRQGFANNVWYYHSFLWREYSLVSFFGFFGWFIFWFKNRSSASLIWILFIAYLGFFCFGFAPYVSRYLLPIFPLLFIGMAYSLNKLVALIPIKQKVVKSSLPLLIVFAIVINGDKFVLKPQAYYSVNHDMREIAVVDYSQVYNIIKSGIATSDKPIPVIETWAPRAMWYLGLDYRPLYWFRWIDEPGTINGIGKATHFELNSKGERVIPESGSIPIGFVGDLSDLISVLNQYDQGYIWIDDTSRPKDVIEYAEANFYNELELSSYHPELIENPYSIWPGTLYSWGFND